MYTKVFCAQKLDSPGRRKGGGEELHEIPSLVRVWIFSGATHWPRGFAG